MKVNQGPIGRNCGECGQPVTQWIKTQTERDDPYFVPGTGTEVTVIVDRGWECSPACSGRHRKQPEKDE